MIRLLFPTPVNFIKLNEPTNLIRDEVGFLLDNGYTSKLRSGVNGQRIDLTNEILDKQQLPYISKLLRSIQDSIFLYCKELQIKPQYLVESWININDYKSFNRKHNHPGSVLSGAYYISCHQDSRSPICFYRTREFTDCGWEQQSLNNSVDLQSSYEHYPKENDLIIFPSFLDHDVGPNNSSHNRISLSFNTTP